MYIFLSQTAGMRSLTLKKMTPDDVVRNYGIFFCCFVKNIFVMILFTSKNSR